MKTDTRFFAMPQRHYAAAAFISHPGGVTLSGARRVLAGDIVCLSSLPALRAPFDGYLVTVEDSGYGAAARVRHSISERRRSALTALRDLAKPAKQSRLGAAHLFEHPVLLFGSRVERRACAIAFLPGGSIRKGALCFVEHFAVEAPFDGAEAVRFFDAGRGARSRLRRAVAAARLTAG